MSRPDRSPLDDAAEADFADQHIAVDDVDEESWRDTQQHIAADRDWQADEADLLEQAMALPDDDAEFDR